ncbi:MAG: acyl-CoA dehydrogenase family protein [Clostridiales Family XIII bacterium]|jgi:alkylation response protein AidB-like acyl-CoA dehydrogenase|nr:acyl-CoA dehydrogenase family protein [Clostridiales Family XIII bacterium]
MILSEKHSLIRKLVRDFAETEITQEIQDRIEETEQYPQELYRKIASNGLFGIKAPKDLGGQGADTLAYVIAIEEFSRVSMVTAIYVSGANSLGSGPLMLAGTREQLEKYLAPVARGEKYPSFGLTEPGAGSDAGGVATTAVRDGDYYVLNGRKCFITAAPVSDFCIVFAKTDPSKGSRGISTFIVDMKLPGVSFGKPEKKMGIIGCPTGDVILEDVRVHRDDLLGEENRGFTNAMKTLDFGRLGVGAQSVGVAQNCLEEAVKYAKERKQFGRRIADFQGVSFMIADMATEIAAARELLYDAAVLKDSDGPQASMHCSMAKYFASEMCNRVAYKSMQIHGGYGYIKDYKIERLYRDARVNSIFEGTSQIQQMVIANSLLK